MQKPVICFYENNKYLRSTDYRLLSCPDDMDAFQFLNQTQSEYKNAMKVLKINYQAFTNAPTDKKPFIKTSKIDVFILSKYDIITNAELQTTASVSSPKFSLTTDKNIFTKNIESIKKDIGHGRLYQVNYTAALKASVASDFSTLDYFYQTAMNTQGNYKAFLPLPVADILCFSPELFLEKKGDVIRTQPIKGTLVKGDTLTSLEKSEKENAELSMIVDLLRNDLNSLSCPVYKDHSRVNFHRKLMQLGYTAHTYSEVEIKSSMQLPEVLQKTFPGGSISGCPKIESLITISEVENYERDFYTGSIGWWKDDEFSLNITIRSLGCTDQEMYYFTGCGIVYDSDPEKEWQEYLTKCSFLYFEPILDTLKMTTDGFTYLDEHIERTFLAFADQGIEIDRNKLAEIYNDIAKQRKDSRVRVVFNRDLSYRAEYQTLPTSKSNVALQLTQAHGPLPRFKTTNRSHWDKYLSTKAPQADDVLIHNNELVLETSIYNIFYKINDQFYTPPLTDGCLHGVFRAYQIKKGSITFNDRTFSLSERSLHLSELSHVELYVGNSVRGLTKATLLF